MLSAMLTLYKYDTCFYCRRVFATLDELGLDVAMRDIRRDPGALAELMAARGRRTVPVLKIERDDGSVQWLPESRDIIRYLRTEYGGDHEPQSSSGGVGGLVRRLFGT